MIQWLAISSVFAPAAAVQGLTGAGYALVAAPVLLIAAPTLVPVPLLLVEFVLIVAMVIREHYAIDIRALVGALVASLPGTAIGVGILVGFPPRVVTILTSVAITVLAGPRSR